VAVDAVVGHPCEGDAEVLADGLGREGDLQLARDELRVVVEGLVEVAEAEKEDGVGIALLELEVLPADGGRHAARSGRRGWAIVARSERMCVAKELQD
jgi:hypothetical protein